MHNPNDLLLSEESARVSEDLQTPRQLPRSRTFSYIPRQVKIDAKEQSVVESNEATEPSLGAVMTDAKPLPPSRIPTPSPPQSKRRASSPRQHLPHHPLLQAKAAANRKSFIGARNASPTKAAVRSRTTPNLLKATNTSQSASHMAPRKPVLKKPSGSSTPQKPVLTENIPTSKRVAQRRSQIQEKSVKQESLAVPSTSPNRRSFGPGTPLAQSKRTSFAAPSVTAKRLSSHLAQTPVTAKRATTKRQEERPKPNSPRPSDEVVLAEPQPRTPERSSTPTLSTVECIFPPLAPQPRARETENDTQKRNLGTPNGLGGVWRPSKVFAAANHQVRRLPRSSTFHHFGRRGTPPPVPPIPNHYRLPSSSNLRSVLQQYRLSTLSNLRHRFPMTSGKFGSSSRSLLSEIASAQKSTEPASLKSVSNISTVSETKVAEDSRDRLSTNEVRETPRTDNETSASVSGSCDSTVQSKVSLASIALPPVEAKRHLKRTRQSNSILRSAKPTRDLQSQRQWSTSELFYPDTANHTSRVQVKDYMPPLYWAGRFQSLFDQWRTEAMVVALNLEIKPEDDGSLGQCRLDDEKKATILIFMQLRDLCASAQAADSLHVRSTTFHWT